jgi:8-oxo-dGTP pyrophosphatase MutT (NUDIX family)
VTPDQIAERLAALAATEPKGKRRAAVAAVLRWEGGRPEVLLMLRAEHPDDRWSGHVSMPGGREEPGDPDLVATAVRETREELGVDLTYARLLGRLEPTRAVARGKILPMTITPFVFHQLRDEPLVLSAEAAAAFWLPLDEAASGRLDASYDYRLGPVKMRLPCWRHQGHVVWGLTYQMLKGLLEKVG